MFIYIKLNKDIYAYNEGAPNRGPLTIPMKGPREGAGARQGRDRGAEAEDPGHGQAERAGQALRRDGPAAVYLYL